MHVCEWRNWVDWAGSGRMRRLSIPTSARSNLNVIWCEWEGDRCCDGWTVVWGVLNLFWCRSMPDVSAICKSIEVLGNASQEPNEPLDRGKVTELVRCDFPHFVKMNLLLFAWSAWSFQWTYTEARRLGEARCWEIGILCSDLTTTYYPICHVLLCHVYRGSIAEMLWYSRGSCFLGDRIPLS